MSINEITSQSFDNLVLSLAKEHTKLYFKLLGRYAKKAKEQFRQKVTRINREYFSKKDFNNHLAYSSGISDEVKKAFREMSVPFNGTLEYGCYTVYSCVETFSSETRLNNSKQYLFIQYYTDSSTEGYPSVIRILFEGDVVKESYVKWGYRQKFNGLNLKGMCLEEALNKFFSVLYDPKKH